MNRNMSSPQQAENTQQPDDSGVGALLKASRLRIGEDLREVSDILRIRHVYLEAIEDGRYDELPGTIYAIGFIRAYADHLGLDSDEVIRRFKGRTSGGEPAPELMFPEPISEAGIPGGAIVFVGALVAVLAYGVWYVNTSEEGFLAELISPVPDRLAKLADEESKPEQAAPAPEPIQKDPGQKTEPETQPAGPAEPATTAPAPASGTPDQAVPEPEKIPEKVAEKAPQAARVPEPKPEAQKPAETEKKPEPEDSPEQQAAAWEPPPGVVKPPAPEPPPPPPAAPEAAPSAPVPAEAQPAPATANVTASVTGPVTTGGSSPAAPEPRTTLTTRAPEPINAPTVVPMDMIPSVPASPRPEADAAAPAAPASTPATAPAGEKTPEARSATAETPAREAAAPDSPAPESQGAETASAPARGASLAMAVGGAGRIVVKAKANSWIQVRDDAAGELVLTRMLKSGDSYIVPDRSGLILSTGNAGALEILVDGKPVPAVGGEGTVRRKIVLDAERLKSGTAVRD